MKRMEPIKSAPDIDLILFDVDNTLYPRTWGWRRLDRLTASEPMSLAKLNLPPDEAEIVQKRYWIEYGTTIAGLIHEHDVDPAPYLADVHDVAVHDHLRPNPALDAILAALPYRKAVFTNATATHARNVLEALDILDHFELLVGLDEVGYLSKPNPLAYERCLDLLGLPLTAASLLRTAPSIWPPQKPWGHEDRPGGLCRTSSCRLHH